MTRRCAAGASCARTWRTARRWSRRPRPAACRCGRRSGGSLVIGPTAWPAWRASRAAIGAPVVGQRPLRRAAAWVKVRPPAASEHLLLSLPRTGQPPRALTTRDVARTVARHAEAAGLREDRRTPHVLRHTFCTHLGDSGADVGTIRELAGHADIRTTTIYTAVSTTRLEHAITERSRRRQGIRRAAPGD